MNFKKFISSVSALAIAASAFAAMSVTVSAASDVTLTSTKTYQTNGSAITESTAPSTYSTQYRDGTAAPGTVKFNSNATAVLYTFDISGLSGTVTSATLNTTLTGSGDGKYISNIRWLGYNGDATTGTLSNGSGTITGLVTDTGSFQPLNDTGSVTTGADFPYNYSKNATTYVNSAVANGNSTVTFAVIHNSVRRADWAATATLDVTTAAATAKYTLKYADEDGNELKTLEKDGEVGSVPTIADSEKASFNMSAAGTDHITYTYLSDDADSQTVEAGDTTVVTLTYSATKYYKVTVKESYTNTTIASGVVAEGDSFTYGYPKYLTDANKNITATCTARNFQNTITPDENKEIIVTYNAFSGTGRFVEHETLGGVTGATGSALSGGKASRGDANGRVAFTVPETGWYNVTIAGSARNTNNNEAVYAVLADETTILSGYFGASSDRVLTDGTFTERVYLTEGQEIKVTGNSGNTNIDYVAIIAIPHTAATYDTTLTEAYNGTTGDNVWAKAYTFTVTPNDDTVTAVKVTASTDAFVEKTGLNLTGTGAIIFGIIAATETDGSLDGITFTPSITVAE